jgi:hypothetical protein
VEEALLLPFDSQLECLRLDEPNDLASPPIAHTLYEDETIVVLHVIGCSFLPVQISGWWDNPMSSADMGSSLLQGLNRRAVALLRATSLPYNLVALSSCSIS